MSGSKQLTLFFMLAVVGPPSGHGQLTVASAPRHPGIEFRMEDAKWVDVFVWLTKQSGVPFIGSPPSGRFTFIGEKGKRYRISEIVDIINQGLRKEGLMLIKRPQCFSVVAVEGVNVRY